MTSMVMVDFGSNAPDFGSLELFAVELFAALLQTALTA